MPQCSWKPPAPSTKKKRKNSLMLLCECGTHKILEKCRRRPMQQNACGWLCNETKRQQPGYYTKCSRFCVFVFVFGQWSVCECRHHISTQPDFLFRMFTYFFLPTDIKYGKKNKINSRLFQLFLPNQCFFCLQLYMQSGVVLHYTF